MNIVLNLLKSKPELNNNLQMPKIDTSFTKAFKEENNAIEFQKIALLQQLNTLEKQGGDTQEYNEEVTYSVPRQEYGVGGAKTKNSIKVRNKTNTEQGVNRKIKNLANKAVTKQRGGEVNTKSVKVVKEAEKMLNKPYIWGASPTSNKGADCSSLVSKAVYKAKKLKIPRTAQAQWESKIGKRVDSPKNLKKGDVLYFKFPNKRGVKVSHTAIYAGNGKFIEASGSFGRVVKRDLPKRYLNPKYLVGIKRY